MSSRNGIFNKFQELILDKVSAFPVLDYPDAENVLQLLSSQNLPPAQNYFNYVNADLPWVMQYYARNYILSHKYLKNFMYSDIIYNNIKHLKIVGK